MFTFDPESWEMRLFRQKRVKKSTSGIEDASVARGEIGIAMIEGAVLKYLMGCGQPDRRRTDPPN